MEQCGRSKRSVDLDGRTAIIGVIVALRAGAQRGGMFGRGRANVREMRASRVK